VSSPLSGSEQQPHRISVVVPVYQGERTLPALLTELSELTDGFLTPDGNDAVVSEVLLVYDHGPDGSAATIRALAEKYDQVRPVWLSRNFGQHAATLAGMASSGGDWIVTMDEDGQHDPTAIGDLLDTALREQARIVYAQPVNPPPHGALRNAASRGAKRMTDLLTAGTRSRQFQSFRLVVGELGRSVAAYAGSGVYLDVALSWVTDSVATCPVRLRSEDRPSGYRLRTLVSHFWRMVLTSGTRALRMVSFVGVLFAVAGVALAVFIGVARATGAATPEGWTSTVIIVLLTSGAVLVSLGIIAEYLGLAVNMALGKPAYLIVSDPQAGPLGRARGR
jgi:undecaprenyl-phosphate 4-deoxy-4-formamido-L-arabinose transferase